MRVEEIDPLVNVIAFEKAVGGELPSACSVGARVGHEYSESMGQEKLRVSGHANAVVAKTMEQKNCIAVGVMRLNQPGTEGDTIARGERSIAQLGVQCMGVAAHGGDIAILKRAASGMKGAVSNEDPSDHAHADVKQQCKEQSSRPAR